MRGPGLDALVCSLFIFVCIFFHSLRLLPDHQYSTRESMKRNIRLNSLAPDRQVASRDCRLCTKRRIRCDRSIPGCRKCASRGLGCPGFDAVPLKWGQGVASRGKLAGRTLPVSPGGGSEEQDGLSGALSVRPRIDDDSGRGHDQDLCTWTNDGSRLWDFSTHLLDPMSGLDLVNRFSADVLVDNLLSHFHLEVASMLRWLDSSDNPWRSIILPLARRSNCLRLSILGLAAAHLSVTSAGGSTEEPAFLQANHSLREASLRILNTKIRYELDDGHATGARQDGSSLIEILATMLVLCYGEMLVPYSTNWALHLRACRAIIDRRNLRNRQRESQDPAARFLVMEVVDLETFVSVAPFTREQGSAITRYSPRLLEGHFWTFTPLLRDITAVERRRYGALQKGCEPPGMDMSTWRAKIDEAYAQTSEGATTILPGDEDTRRRFEALLRAHYYACFVYCYQALAPMFEARQVIDGYVGPILDEIQFLANGSARSFSQNVFFPLFIAGTEYGRDEHGQAMIQGLFMDLIISTGSWCNHAVLQFLRAYWARLDSQETWIQYARRNEQNLTPFLIF
ncbi:hypothetical protein P170DRAFT_248289 [Aspergillus steynii IBT 23096]|uniref:Zn(2)-C6 fungal-type domain-containing protein n=1 Tax=Aspergillus steynii IBT 23096 TaxID=1392250 RepID=A0A2I2FYC5_9EURO|nr:uncharacterized protein P170DRAFT_248289 [Aspergillus steynii IBT 23096]PLB45639.1 hypothetical protein P170DRAFT_248289 [Aspergillus steynii IBT 23096]